MPACRPCVLATIAALCVGACRNGDTARTKPEDGTVLTSAPTPGTKPAAAPVREPEVVLTRVADGLVGPTDLVTRPDGTLVVIDQPGRVYAIEGGELRELADLSDRIVRLKGDYDERGLLGLAYADDTTAYVYYSAPLARGASKDYDHANVLAEYRVQDDGTFDAKSERVVLTIDWPAPNHDGGTLAFGPDGMLYVAMGDGGMAGDIGRGHPPMGNGQDWTTLMGSILRIDPRERDGAAYSSPKGNPFAGEHPGKDEIWAYGLRNPYAFSFDSQTERMFAGDVGQDIFEEVNIIERGKNYGWHVKEGASCYDPDDPYTPLPDCENEGEHGEPLVDPVLQYPQLDSKFAETSEIHGTSVIGGDVYRGKKIPELAGAYVFGDWSIVMDRPQGVLLVGRERAGGWSLARLPVRDRETEHLGMYIRGFGRDRDGEIYVLTSERQGPTGTTGTVWRIDP